jgi:hypothetical protein
MSSDASISEEFREKALRYTSGETIFLLDGSAGFRDARLECSARIGQIKSKIGADVMTMIWGNDNGSVVVSRPEDVRRLGDLENGMLLPTLEEVQISVRHGVYKKPLHIVLAANSAFFDDPEKLETCFGKLMAESEVHLDVLLGRDTDQRLRQMLMELQETDALKSRPDTPLRLVFLNGPEGIGNVLVGAINNRLAYDAIEPDRAAAAMMRGATEKVKLMPRLILKVGQE